MTAFVLLFAFCIGLILWILTGIDLDEHTFKTAMVDILKTKYKWPQAQADGFVNSLEVKDFILNGFSPKAAIHTLLDFSGTDIIETK